MQEKPIGTPDTLVILIDFRTAGEISKIINNNGEIPNSKIIAKPSHRDGSIGTLMLDIINSHKTQKFLLSSPTLIGIGDSRINNNITFMYSSAININIESISRTSLLIDKKQ